MKQEREPYVQKVEAFAFEFNCSIMFLHEPEKDCLKNPNNLQVGGTKLMVHKRMPRILVLHKKTNKLKYIYQDQFDGIY